MQRLFITLVILIPLSHVAKAADRYDFVVAQNGTGNFTTLQAAIDSVPSLPQRYHKEYHLQQ